MGELRGKFQENRKFRMQVYLAAAIMTLINIMALSLFGRFGANPLSTLGLVITAGGTLALYYISDGITAFAALMTVISKIASVFAKGMTFLTAWAVGLGVLLQILIPVFAVGGVLLFGLVFAYTLPIVFVPVLHMIGRFLKRRARAKQAAFQGTKASGTAADDVDWNRVYGRVMTEVNR